MDALSQILDKVDGLIWGRPFTDSSNGCWYHADS